MVLCLALLVILLVPQHEPSSPPTPRPHGLGLTGLVSVNHAEPLRAERYVEAVLEDGEWAIYQEGRSVASGNGAPLIEKLEILFPIDEPKPSGPLVISAPGATTLDKIFPIARTGMRGSGKAVHLLVASGSGVRTIIMRSARQSIGCAVAIYITRESRIQIDSESAALDHLSEGPPYRQLDEMLQLYSTAAKAAQSKGVLHLVAHSDTRLEDFLKLASHISSFGIWLNAGPEWDPPSPNMDYVARPMKKPSSPFSHKAKTVAESEARKNSRIPPEQDK